MQFQVKGVKADNPRKEEVLIVDASSENEAFLKAKLEGIQAYEIIVLKNRGLSKSRKFPASDLIIVFCILAFFSAAIFGLFYLLTLDVEKSPDQQAGEPQRQNLTNLRDNLQEPSSDQPTNVASPPEQKLAWSSIIDEGAKAEKTGDYLEAIRVYADALEEYPDSELLYLYIGQCLSKLDENEKEISIYQKGVANFPESELLVESLANAYLRNRQYGDAARAYAKAVDLKPNDAGTWFFYGSSLMRSGRNKDAEDAFLHSSAIEPDVANTWHNLALVSARQKNFPSAIMHYTRALRIDVGNKEAWQEYTHTITKYGPHRAYCLAWANADERSDYRALRERAKEDVMETTYAVFPQLRSDQDRMWIEMERALASMQKSNPDVIYDPTTSLRCALLAAQQLGIRPYFPNTSSAESGQLTIENKTGSDALVKVYDLDKKRVWRNPSVLNGGSATLRRVPDGHYLILFALTDKLTPHSSEVGSDARASKFEKSILFTTSKELSGNTIYEESTSYRISLHEVVGGNAKTSGIPLDEFMEY